MQIASASAPSPPLSVGTWAAKREDFTSALCASCGYLCSSSTARAKGEISFSASALTLSRRSLYSAGSVKIFSKLTADLLSRYGVAVYSDNYCIAPGHLVHPWQPCALHCDLCA